MNGADVVGILILIVLWLALVTWLGIWVGVMITRRNRRR